MNDEQRMYEEWKWEIAKAGIKNMLESTLVKVNGKQSPPMILNPNDRRTDLLKKVDANAKIVQAMNIPLMNLTDVVMAKRSSKRVHHPRPSVTIPILRRQTRESNQFLSWRAKPGSNDDHIEEKVILPPEKMGCAIGKQFTNVNRLEKTHGVIVIIPERGGQVIILKGLTSNVAAAKNDLLKHLQCPPCTVL